MKPAKKPPYRLALDIGTNSIGWACLALAEEKEKIVDRETGEVRPQHSPIGFLKNGKNAGGVIIFPEGRRDKDLTTLNTKRRESRGRRHVVAAKKWRLQKLRKFFIKELSCDPEKIDVHLGARLKKNTKTERKRGVFNNIYELRFEAAHKPLDAAEKLAAVLLHMARHRYFQSNSLAADDDDKSEKDWQKSEGELRTAMEKRISEYNSDAKERRRVTVGGYYCLLLRDFANREKTKAEERRGAGVRQLVKVKADNDKKGDNKAEKPAPISPARARPLPATRKLLREEFAHIREKQEKQFKQLSEDNWKDIEDWVLDQRPLKPQTPGDCSFLKGKKCAAEALPTIARWRIMQIVTNNILLSEKGNERGLSKEERDSIVNLMCKNKKVTHAQIKEELKLKRNVKVIDKTAADSTAQKKGDELAEKLGDESALGEAYHGLPLEERDAIVRALLAYRKSLTTGEGASRRNKEKARETLNKAFVNPPFDQFNLEAGGDVAEALAEIARFGMPTGYVSVCEEVAKKTLEKMGEDPACVFAIAAELCKYKKRAEIEKGEAKYLSYYGDVLQHRVSHKPRSQRGGKKTAAHKFGMVNNITVHVALNQLRKLVNALIDAHGKPEEVVVEMNRDMAKGAIERKKILGKQKKGEEQNEAIKEAIWDATNGKPPQCGLGQARMRYKLWKKQGENDLYDFTSNEPKISAAALYGNGYQIDHVIPRSRGGVDKPWNMIVTAALTNQGKGDHTPKEIFNKDEYKHFLNRAKERIPQTLGYIKNWEKDVKKRGEEDANTFLARQATDAPYITRLALEYISDICKNVWGVNGHMTHAFARELGFRRVPGDATRLYKDRRDVRNHFLDAVIVGLIDRKRVQAWHTLHRKGKKEIVGRDFFTKNVRASWDDYYGEIRDLYKKILPARRQKHLLPRKKQGARGQLHEETHRSVWRNPTDREREVFEKKGWKPRAVRIKRKENANDEIRHDSLGHRWAATEIAAKIQNSKNPDKLELLKGYIKKMPDMEFANKIKNSTEDFMRDGKKPSEAFLTVCQKYGVHKIRLIEKGEYKKIRRGVNSAAVKSGSNDRLEIWRGKNPKAWRGKIVSFLEAARERTEGKKEGAIPPNNLNGGQYLGCFRRGDYVKLEHSKILWVVKGMKINKKQGALLSLWPVLLAPVEDKEIKKHKRFYTDFSITHRDGRVLNVGQLEKKKACVHKVNILGKLTPLPWS